MKKIIAFLLALTIAGLFILRTGIVLVPEIHAEYSEKIGNMTVGDKFKSLVLLKEAVKRGDDLFVFGSSELEKIKGTPFHPANFFNNKKDGFQTDLIGAAGYQDLVHAVAFSALGRELRGQKVVLIISPQWFIRSGLTQNTFLANSSEEEIYALFFNKTLDNALKKEFAKRISALIIDDSNFKSLKLFCRLYKQDGFLYKALLFILKPYYEFRYYILKVKDGMRSLKLLNANPGPVKSEPPLHTSFDWQKEKAEAVDYGRKVANGNPFYIDNNTYKSMQKSMVKFKKATGSSSYLVSPEYADLRLLLDVCRDQGIKPLIISVPVNGFWYDYCGFGKSGRLQYYQNIKRIVASYGFDFTDLSGHEYDRYFMYDTVHLGWKGWIYVNEAIDRYFHETKTQ